MKPLNKNKMKETAVEWLLENLNSEPYSEKEFNYNSDCWDKAQEMEKEQITLSHINGQSEFDTEKFRQYNKDLAEAYYNQTFKLEEQ